VRRTGARGARVGRGLEEKEWHELDEEGWSGEERGRGKWGLFAFGDALFGEHGHAVEFGDPFGVELGAALVVAEGLEAVGFILMVATDGGAGTTFLGAAGHDGGYG